MLVRIAKLGLLWWVAVCCVACETPRDAAATNRQLGTETGALTFTPFVIPTKDLVPDTRPPVVRVPVLPPVLRLYDDPDLNLEARRVRALSGPVRYAIVGRATPKPVLFRVVEERGHLTMLDAQGELLFRVLSAKGEVWTDAQPFVLPTGTHALLVVGTHKACATCQTKAIVTVIDARGSVLSRSIYDGKVSLAGGTTTTATETSFNAVVQLSSGVFALLGSIKPAGSGVPALGAGSGNRKGQIPYVLVQRSAGWARDVGFQTSSAFAFALIPPVGATTIEVHGEVYDAVATNEGQLVIAGRIRDSYPSESSRYQGFATTVTVTSGSPWQNTSQLRIGGVSFGDAALGVARINSTEVVVAGETSNDNRAGRSGKAGFLSKLRVAANGDLRYGWETSSGQQGPGLNEPRGLRLFGGYAELGLRSVAVAGGRIVAGGDLSHPWQDSLLTQAPSGARSTYAALAMLSLDGATRSVRSYPEHSEGAYRAAFHGLAATIDLGAVAVGSGTVPGGSIFVAKLDRDLQADDGCNNRIADGSESRTGKRSGNDYFGDCGGVCPVACDVDCGDGTQNHGEACVDGGGPCEEPENNADDEPRTCGVDCAALACDERPVECPPCPTSPATRSGADIVSERCTPCHGDAGEGAARPCLYGAKAGCVAWAVTCGTGTDSDPRMKAQSCADLSVKEVDLLSSWLSTQSRSLCNGAAPGMRTCLSTDKAERCDEPFCDDECLSSDDRLSVWQTDSCLP